MSEKVQYGIIPLEGITNIFNYLKTRPYEEVVNLIPYFNQIPVVDSLPEVTPASPDDITDEDLSAMQPAE